MAHKIYKELMRFMSISLIFSKTVIPAITVMPTDVEALVGEVAYFNCSTSNKPAEVDDVLWYHTPVLANQREEVYDEGRIRYRYEGRFSVETDLSAGAFNLVVSNATLEDAGRYECQDGKGHGEKAPPAELIILDTEPVCQTNTFQDGFIGENSCGLQPDEIEFSCIVPYNGKVSPVMEWREVGRGSSISLARCSSPSGSPMTCNLTLKAELSLSGSSYVCQTTRSHGKTYFCSSTINQISHLLNVNSTIKKMKNDNVTCTLSASHSCSYTWYDSQRNLLSYGRHLKPMNPGLYRCEAQCTVRSSTCTITAMEIEVLEEAAVSGANLHPLWILLLPVAIAILLYSAWKWRNGKRKKAIFAKIGYKSDPVLLEEIRTKSVAEENKSIRGLTILDEELFTVSTGSSVVEVYDSIELSFIRRFELKELICPEDIGSCNRNKCLYIMDWKDKSSEILRVDPNGKLINRWSTGNDWGRLSVTGESNVILADFNINKFTEYSPDGQLIREVKLSSDEGLLHPLHAVKLTDGHFVVTHGNNDHHLHRVCLVDVDGNVKKSFGEKEGSTDGQLNRPVYLAVYGNGSILVADRNNHRVLLLDSNLKFKREIVSGGKHRLREPSRICLDESNGRLFVVDNHWDEEKEIFTDGRVLVFNVN